MIRDIAVKILNLGYVCDSCLGRQFAKLLSGYSNRERGKIIRMYLAMEYETRPFEIHLPNFYGFAFRKRKVKTKKPGKCVICKNLFEELPRFAGMVEKKLKGVEFERFMVGVRMSDSLVIAEESLWERAGIAYLSLIHI